jgi:hypothetical protein
VQAQTCRLPHRSDSVCVFCRLDNLVGRWSALEKTGEGEQAQGVGATLPNPAVVEKPAFWEGHQCPRSSGMYTPALTAIDTNKATFGRSRPMCVYPGWPKYTGAGSLDAAESYACVTE